MTAIRKSTVQSGRLVALLASGLLLAACDGDGGGGGGGDGDGDPQGIASLGQDFVNAFNLAATDEPVETVFEERERFTAGLQWTRPISW